MFSNEMVFKSKYNLDERVEYTMKEGAETKTGIIKTIMNHEAVTYHIKPDKAKSNADMDVIPEAHINGKV